MSRRSPASKLLAFPRSVVQERRSVEQSAGRVSSPSSQAYYHSMEIHNDSFVTGKAATVGAPSQPRDRTALPRTWDPSLGIVFSRATTPVPNVFDIDKAVLDSQHSSVPRPQPARAVSAPNHGPSTSLGRVSCAAPMSKGQSPMHSSITFQARSQSTNTASSDGILSSEVARAAEFKGVAEPPQDKANKLLFSLRGLIDSLSNVGFEDPPKESKKAAETAEDGAEEAEAPCEFWTYEHHGSRTGSTPTLHVCETLESADAAMEHLQDDEVLGLDLEWVSNSSSDMDPKRRVSLIQVAGRSHIVLIQVARFTGTHPAELMPAKLRTLLESATAKKTGVNIRNDCTRLRESFGVAPRAVYELSHLHRLVKHAPEGLTNNRNINKKLVALAAQVHEHLGLPLRKEQHVRAGDWTRPLTAEQKLYAASDAFAGLVLFDVLEAKRAALDPMPPLPDPLELAPPSMLRARRPERKQDSMAAKDAVADPAAAEAEGEEEGDDTVAGWNTDEAHEPFSEAPMDAAADDSASPAAAQALLAAATAWANTHRASVLAPTSASRGSFSSTPCPSAAQLRAYHLWHAERLSVPATARVLGIKPASVAGYVLEALMVGRLDGEAERVATAARYVPARVLRMRYAGFLKRVLEREERRGGLGSG